jgi:hypothetical protein
MPANVVGRNKAKPHCADISGRVRLADERCNALRLIAPSASEGVL